MGKRNLGMMLAVAGVIETVTPKAMRIEIENRQRQLAKSLKTCKCGKGFNHRGYMCRECFEENKK